VATTQRTYSFDGPPELADRLARAREAFAKLAGAAPDVEEWTAREVEMALARLRSEAPALASDSAAFMRAAVELMVGVVEKVSAGLDAEPALREWEQEDTEGEAFRRGALESARRIWQDE
jgi:hypothetical protein